MQTHLCYLYGAKEDEIFGNLASERQHREDSPSLQQLAIQSARYRIYPIQT